MAREKRAAKRSLRFPRSFQRGKLVSTRTTLKPNHCASVNLEMLKWARERGCPWDQRTCSSAASRGQLDLLKWARENGCPWDNTTCWAAAYDRRWEVLKWARENGCPWDAAIYSHALRKAEGCPEVMQWLYEQGSP